MTENPTIFAKKEWKFSADAKPKEFIYDKYLQRCKDTGWNQELEVPILLTCHGTDYGVAMTIASTGFAALSSLDSGWYGAGIYFTTYAMYTTPYFALRKDPAIILSFVTPGNVFPTTENHKGPNSLLGKVLNASYTAHYVGLDATGIVPNYSETKLEGIDFLYDEIVVSQEPQICPVYVLRICPKMRIDNWDRREKGKRKSTNLPTALFKNRK
eukprot:TRINITY_DN11758_c0_g1_i1.p1 TRINITY_DN11758_c0_g1~~TRINITY_DN11758_c0_g1_i1.p1  ORF type:complete len:228 (+),score=28.88 TRINITY_DN11758_c0_g1_i1:48-686(+)